MTQTIRVFIVDDSPLARIVLRQMLERDPQIRVVGEANRANDALRRIPEVRPDVITMDMIMPGMDGLETTRKLMAEFPRPILLVSDLVGRDADLNFRALESGAVDLMRKPSAEEHQNPEVARQFQRKVRVLSRVPVVTRHLRRVDRAEPLVLAAETRVGGRPRMVLIGASTGGPVALHQILAGLGGPIASPILVVQHMTPGFTKGMAQWLGETLDAEVRLAEDGVEPVAGATYIAPEGRHLCVRGNRMYLDRGTATSGHCPSVDALFESAAKSELAEETLAVLLTGMGEDGARGMQALRRAGGWTIAQDQATSIVYGMPRAAVALGAAAEQLALGTIAPRLLEICGRRT